MFPTNPTESACPRVRARLDLLQGRVQAGLQAIAISRRDPSANPFLVDIYSQEGRAIHGGRQRLRPTHTAQAAGYHQPVFQGAAEVLSGALGKGLVGTLQNSLSPDVDPGAGGHLAVHREAQGFESAELVPGGPPRDQVSVRD